MARLAERNVSRRSTSQLGINLEIRMLQTLADEDTVAFVCSKSSFHNQFLNVESCFTVPMRSRDELAVAGPGRDKEESLHRSPEDSGAEGIPIAQWQQLQNAPGFAVFPLWVRHQVALVWPR